MDKYNRLRIESWCKKFCQVSNNQEWKKNRNLHAISLLDMIINQRIEEPYKKFPPSGPLPQLSKTLVKSKLTKKFWESTRHIYDESAPKENKELEKEIEKPVSNLFKNNKNNKSKKSFNINYNNLIKSYNDENANILLKSKTSNTFMNSKNNSGKKSSNKGKIIIDSSNNLRSQNRKIRAKTPTMNNNLGNIDTKKNNENMYKSKNIERDNVELKKILLKLENELQKKDEIIGSQKEEIKKLKKRVETLEKMLETFLNSK